MSRNAAVQLMLAAVSAVILAVVVVILAVGSEWMGGGRYLVIVGAVILGLGSLNALRLRP